MTYSFSQKMLDLLKGPVGISPGFMENLIWEYISTRGEIKTISARVDLAAGTFYHPSLTEDHARGIIAIVERVYCV